MAPVGSSLEFFGGHLGTNSVWRQIGSPLGFAIPRDSFSGIPPFFPPLGFTLLICLWGHTFSPVGGLLFFSFLGGLHHFSVDDRYWRHLISDLGTSSTSTLPIPSLSLFRSHSPTPPLPPLPPPPPSTPNTGTNPTGKGKGDTLDNPTV